MKKLLAFLILCCCIVTADAQYIVKRGPLGSGGFSPTDTCIDFRRTAAFVTDPSPCVYVNSDSNNDGVIDVFYSAGVGFGWESTAGSPIQLTRDRSSSVDARLSGFNGLQAGDTSGASTMTFRIDVPAGTYTVLVVLGDATNNQGAMHATVYDNATSRFTISGSTSSNFFIDTNSVGHASSYVPAGGDAKTGISISSGIFRITIDEAGNTSAFITTTTVAHIRLTRTS